MRLNSDGHRLRTHHCGPLCSDAKQEWEREQARKALERHLQVEKKKGRASKAHA